MDIIAHRGASSQFVENSMPAFAAAIESGASGIEVDLRRSADGVVYCFHDHKLSRLTESTGYFRRTSSKRIDMLKLKDGSSIPRFSEFIHRFAPRTRVILDIKSARIEAAIIELLGEHASAESLVFSSFNPNILKRIKIKCSEANTALIVGPVRNVTMRLKLKSFLTRRLNRLQCRAVHLSKAVTTSGVVKHLKDNGFRVSVWTVDDPDQALEFADIGVDSLMTNDPATVVKAISTRR